MNHRNLIMIRNIIIMGFIGFSLLTTQILALALILEVTGIYHIPTMNNFTEKIQAWPCLLIFFFSLSVAVYVVYKFTNLFSFDTNRE